jgi:hypothetical protein
LEYKKTKAYELQNGQAQAGEDEEQGQEKHALTQIPKAAGMAYRESTIESKNEKCNDHQYADNDIEESHAS